MLEWKGRCKQEILQLSDMRASHECETSRELSLANVNDHLVQGETLEFVNSDCLSGS